MIGYSLTFDISFICILLCFWIRLGKSAICQQNVNCSALCLNQYCEYEPSTNSFYNSSLTTNLTGYQGQGCCNGCSYTYSLDYYYDAVNRNCIQGSCGKDQNGTQQYWLASDINTCYYTCFNYYYKNTDLERCEYYCSEGYFAYNITMECLKNCPEGYFKYIKDLRRQCISNCSSIGTNTNRYTGYCQYPYLYYQYAGICELSCPSGLYKYKVNKNCISLQNCIGYGPGSASGSYINRINASCEYSCTNGLFAGNNTQECVTTCPSGYYKYPAYNNNYQEDLCVPYNNCIKRNRNANNVSGFCQSQCTNQLFSDISGYCVSECTIKTDNKRIYKSKEGWTCVYNCYDHNKYFFDSSTGFCQPKCPDSQFGDTSTGICVESCGSDKFLLQSMKICVSDCNSFASSSPTPNTIYNTKLIMKCVSENQCPFNSLDQVQTYSSSQSHQCVIVCPDNMFAHPESKRCVNECYGKYPYKNIILKMCSPTIDEAIQNYLKTSGIIKDQNFYVITQTNAILILVGIIGAVLLIIGCVVFYKYHLKNKFRHNFMQINSSMDIEYQA